MPPNEHPRARPDLTVVELDGEAVIYDDVTAELHHLNPTATVVFGLCDGTQASYEMAAEIAQAFGVPLDEVEPQVSDIVGRFGEAHLLVGSEPEAADEAIA